MNKIIIITDITLKKLISRLVTDPSTPTGLPWIHAIWITFEYKGYISVYIQIGHQSLSFTLLFT